MCRKCGGTGLPDHYGDECICMKEGDAILFGKVVPGKEVIEYLQDQFNITK